MAAAKRKVVLQRRSALTGAGPQVGRSDTSNPGHSSTRHLGEFIVAFRKSSVAEESARSSRDSGRRCRKLQAAAAVRRSQLCFTLNGEEIRNTSEKVRTFLITEEMSLMEKTKKLRAYDPAIKRPAAQRESLRCR